MRSPISLISDTFQKTSTGRPAQMMSFGDAVKNVVLINYIGFKGRASRSEYWFYSLFTLFVYFITVMIDVGISNIVALGLFLPGLSVTVRRLHDIGRSGWWYLIVIIPIVGLIVLLIFMIIEGEGHPNQYGEVPTNTIEAIQEGDSKLTKRAAFLVSAIIIVSVCVQYLPSEGIFIPEPEPPTGHYGWVLNSDTGELEYVQIPSTTFYHFANATAVSNQIDISSILIGNNTPIFTEGTYYGIGRTTFEPTIGVTKEGNLYMTSWGTGSGGATAIIKCTNMMTMTNASDYSCTDVGPPWVPNSNDPYLYVDLWTDALMKFDMHALTGMTVEFSENEGASWRGPTAITWPYTLQDHQTIASSPYPCQQVLNCYDTTYVFCVNGNYPAPLCSTSFDGGITWSPENEGAPSNCDSGGLTGHIIGSNNGNFYRGNPSCDGSGYSVYRSTNGGFTWTEHVLPTESTGTADTWNFEEVAVATDDEDNVHASWIGLDNLLYYSYSLDQGGSWSVPIMVAPPGVDGTGFVTIAAGSAGKVALGYIGTTNDADGNSTWNGYLTVMTDSFGQYPLITSMAVNTPDDPLDSQKDDCGYDRCGGFGDFIDLVIDESGRPWFGLSHNDAGELGIFATMAEGPSLRGETVALQPLPLGGNITL